MTSTDRQTAGIDRKYNLVCAIVEITGKHPYHTGPQKTTKTSLVYPKAGVRQAGAETMMNRPQLSLKTKTAAPLQLAGGTITLQSRVLEFHFPWGGFVWNRPASVLVKRNGHVQRLAVPDPTLRAMFGLLAINALVALVAVVSRGRRQDQFREGASE